MSRTFELRCDLAWSFMMEPLLSNLKAGDPSDRFAIIIGLNESYRSDIHAAGAYVARRMEDCGPVTR